METIVYLIQSALYIIILLAFFFSLLEYRAKNRVLILVVAAVYYFVTAFVSLALSNLALDTWLTILMVISFCFFFRDWKRVSIAASFFVIIIFLAEPATYHTITLITQLQMSEKMKRLIANCGGISSKLIAGALLYFCAKLLIIAFSKESMPTKYWVGCLVVPCASAFMLYNIYSYHGGYADPIQNLIPAGIIIIINVVMFSIFIQMTNYYQNEIAYRKHVEQLDAFNYHQSNIVSTEASIRGVHHDLKNTLLSLQTSLKEGNIAAAFATINENLEIMNPNFISKTGNFAIDSIINYKARIAEDSGIKVCVHDNVFYKINLNWIDVGVMLSTALDNAIEACKLNDEKGKEIQIYIAVKHQMLIMSITNPFYGSILTNDKGSFLTTKPDKGSHGYGIDSIKRLVDKNSGECEIDYSNGQFSVSIIIPEVQ